jgi:hypothetical protein
MILNIEIGGACQALRINFSRALALGIEKDDVREIIGKACVSEVFSAVDALGARPCSCRRITTRELS